MAIVSFETVAAAAESLTAAGQRPSVRAVLAHLGGGSPNAILKLLNEWKAGRPVVRVEDTALDARIVAAIAEQMQRVAAAAGEEAEARAAGLADDLQAFAEANVAGEQLAGALAVERDGLAAAVADLGRQLAEAQADAVRREQQTAEQVAALRADLAAERARADLAGAALAKAEVRLEVLPTLHDDVARLRAALEAEQKARVAADQLAAVDGAKLEAAIDRADRADAAAAKIEARLDVVAAKLAEFRKIEVEEATAYAEELMAEWESKRSPASIAADLVVIKKRQAEARAAAVAKAAEEAAAPSKPPAQPK